MRLCMHVCTYVCMCTKFISCRYRAGDAICDGEVCIYMYVCMYVCMYVYRRCYMRWRRRIAHTNVCKYIRIAHTNVCKYIHTFVCSTFAYTHIIRMYTQEAQDSLASLHAYVYTHVCMCIRIHTYIHIHKQQDFAMHYIVKGVATSASPRVSALQRFNSFASKGASVLKRISSMAIRSPNPAAMGQFLGDDREAGYVKIHVCVYTYVCMYVL